MSNLDILSNNEIRATSVRLIDSEGTNRGVVSIKEAMKIAYEASLDLVQINNDSTPVCKIIDFSKYKYDVQKKEKEIRRQNKVNLQETHTIKIRPVTSEHDLKIKAKKINQFLEDGDKVKVTVTFFGREVSHPETGREVLNKLFEMLSEHRIDRTNMNETNFGQSKEMFAFILK